MIEKIYILNDYVVEDDAGILEDGELPAIEVKIPKNIKEILVNTKDLNDIESYLFNKTDYLDTLLEFFDEYVGYTDSDRIFINSSIISIFNDEEQSDEINIINTEKETNFNMKDSLFLVS
jgi:hypothetical protein